jgi:hypothetical protein
MSNLQLNILAGLSFIDQGIMESMVFETCLRAIKEISITKRTLSYISKLFKLCGEHHGVEIRDYNYFIFIIVLLVCGQSIQCFQHESTAGSPQLQAQVQSILEGVEFDDLPHSLKESLLALADDYYDKLDHWRTPKVHEMLGKVWSKIHKLEFISVFDECPEVVMRATTFVDDLRNRTLAVLGHFMLNALAWAAE